MSSWDKFWTKDMRRTTQLPFLNSLEQKQGVEQIQGTAHAPCPLHTTLPKG